MIQNVIIKKTTQFNLSLRNNCIKQIRKISNYQYIARKLIYKLRDSVRHSHRYKQTNYFDQNMNNNSLQTTGIAKTIFIKINKSIAAYNTKNSKSIWHSVYKWNYDHHFMKNFLKLLNKTLKGLNKYHVFRIQYLYTFIGMGLGYLVTQLQNNIEKAQNLQYQPFLVNVVKQKVLQNQIIRLKLQEAVNQNVLQNQDIQTNLAYTLLNKVLIPQRDKLPNLVKNALLNLLKSNQIYNIAQTKTVQAIQMNRDIIARQALSFLGGQLMLKIIKEDVAPLIKGQMAQQNVSKAVIKTIKTQLNKNENKQKIYSFIQQKII